MDSLVEILQDVILGCACWAWQQIRECWRRCARSSASCSPSRRSPTGVSARSGGMQAPTATRSLEPGGVFAPLPAVGWRRGAIARTAREPWLRPVPLAGDLTGSPPALPGAAADGARTVPARAAQCRWPANGGHAM